MADQWYFERDGSPAGPVSLDEMQRLARTGVVGRDSRIWSEGMSDWVAAGTIDRLWADGPRPFEAAVVPVGTAGPPRPAAPAYAAPAYAAPVYHAPIAAEVGMRAPAYGAGLAVAPDVERMVGDMRFVGIFTIIYGAFVCLGIITALIGVPIFIMGMRLREAADNFERYARAGDTHALAAAIERQGSYFRIQKIFLLVILCLVALMIVMQILLFGTIMSALSGQ